MNNIESVDMLVAQYLVAGHRLRRALKAQDVDEVSAQDKEREIIMRRVKEKRWSSLFTQQYQASCAREAQAHL